MVEWKKLGEIAEIGTGSNNREDACDNGCYPFYVRSQEVLKIDSYLYDEEAILIPGEGGIGDIFHYVNGKYGLHQRTYRVHPVTDEVKGRYIYYYLFAKFKSYINTKSYKSTAASIRKPMLLDFPILIPSLSEQNRIVGILDTFTASIDNLKEQIAQRRKQYEYYLSCFFSTEKWPENKIGELTKVFSCPRVFKDQWQDSGVPFWRSSDIMSYHNGVINPRGEVYISQSLYDELSSKSDKIKEGDILVTGGGSIGIPYLKKDNSPLFVKDADLICIQKCISIIPKYLYHYFLSTDFKLYLKKITHDATIAHYTINQIKDTPIPLPPLKEQQCFVDILDTFEASIQNLEAQLSQREKQYDYYRNKLLTFE
jgi:type I restriction enzyme S subunit